MISRLVDYYTTERKQIVDYFDNPLKSHFTNFTHSRVFTGLREHDCICDKKAV